MNMKAFHVGIALALVGGFTMSGWCEDHSQVWPRFRGPNGSGIAEKQTPPTEIGPEKNVSWKVPVPPGLSSPIVADNELVITAFEDGKLYTVAFDHADGHELWRKEAPAKQIEAYQKTE